MLALSNTVCKESFISRHVFMRLPRHYKRMIYVSSIFGLILNGEDPDLKLIRKLNEIIHLARDAKTCELPIHIRRVIWKNLDSNNLSIGNGESIAITDIISSQLNSENCNSISEQIARSAPKWLNYGSTTVMSNDIIALIKHLKYLLNGAPYSTMVSMR